jgi:hypothetical protein
VNNVDELLRLVRDHRNLHYHNQDIKECKMLTMKVERLWQRCTVEEMQEYFRRRRQEMGD